MVTPCPSKAPTLYDSLPYNEGLHNVVRDDSGTLKIHDDFVEMNKADGWFEIWRGVEVAPGPIAAD